MTLDQSAQKLASLIEQAQTTKFGRAPSGGKSGQTISIRVNGRSLKVRCLRSIPPGQVVAMLTPSGWVALPSSPTRLVGTRQIDSRQQRGQRGLVIYRELLLSVLEAPTTWQFWVGGDRESSLIQEFTKVAVNPPEGSIFKTDDEDDYRALFIFTNIFSQAQFDLVPSDFVVTRTPSVSTTFDKSLFAARFENVANISFNRGTPAANGDIWLPFQKAIDESNVEQKVFYELNGTIDSLGATEVALLPGVTRPINIPPSYPVYSSSAAYHSTDLTHILIYKDTSASTGEWVVIDRTGSEITCIIPSELDLGGGSSSLFIFTNTREFRWSGFSFLLKNKIYTFSSDYSQLTQTGEYTVQPSVDNLPGIVFQRRPYRA